jgi:electron-transferring-flavoprotein dehydrogenase
VVEKGAEVGAHILSGAVIEPRALNELIPDWKAKGAPLDVEAKEDRFVFLTEKSSLRLPTPPQMHNKGNYIVSLSNVTKWLAQQAEELGVQIFPGTAASEILYHPDGSVKGIATNDIGIGRDGKRKDTYAAGMELHAKLTLFGEGCRGHLTKRLFEKFALRKGVQTQKYAIGIKEVWELDPKQSKPGNITHTLSWPLDMQTYGGSWMYHMNKNLLSVGFVVGLDYRNPYLSPYREFQRFKHHPAIRGVFEGGRPLSYGSRAISAGGFQSIPKLIFPGGALIGDTAGFLNLPKIKGTHTAMKSGILAADAAFDALSALPASGDAAQKPIELLAYPEAFRKSWVYEELYLVRNVKPAFSFGLLPALAINAVDTYLLRGRAPWTLKHSKADHETLLPAAECKPIVYPKPDGVVSFDLLTNLARSNTNHTEDQPIHLTLRDPTIPVKLNLAKYAGPESRYCPAGVYEFVSDGTGPAPPTVPGVVGPATTATAGLKLQINAPNCVHCKTCDIKDPSQNINWVTPEGGGGPLYQNT